MLRDLMTNMGFTISVLVAVIVILVFAFVFEAPGDLIITLLWLGLITAVMEYVMRTNWSDS